MYFRLLAAIFDFPGYPGVEACSQCTSPTTPTVLLDLENGVTCRKFSDFTLDSRHPIYIRSDGRHFYFLWAWLGIM